VIPPFPDEGIWLRCQLHCHSTQSDGDSAPADVVATYRALDCDVLAITDHWLITRVEGDGMLIVAGSELSASLGDDFDVDVLAYGIERLPEPREPFASIAEAASWIVREGGVAFLAHPYWSGLAPHHFLEAPDLAGIEVWNGASELTQGNGLSAVHWDDILHRGGRCLGIATDDAHYTGQDNGLGWTMVRVTERTVEAVLVALRAGSFYSTAGPEIHAVRPVEGGVEVDCSPASAVALRSGPWDGCRVAVSPRAGSWRGGATALDDDGAIVSARFEVPEYWRWGRVEVVDREGALAWSNPFPVGTPA
jgi:hypothetical protein